MRRRPRRLRSWWRHEHESIAAVLATSQYHSARWPGPGRRWRQGSTARHGDRTLHLSLPCARAAEERPQSAALLRELPTDPRPTGWDVGRGRGPSSQPGRWRQEEGGAAGGARRGGGSWFTASDDAGRAYFWHRSSRRAVWRLDPEVDLPEVWTLHEPLVAGSLFLVSGSLEEYSLGDDLRICYRIQRLWLGFSADICTCVSLRRLFRPRFHVLLVSGSHLSVA